jgi:hypothetical protein
MSVGLGAVFVTVTTAANAGVPTNQAGLAAGLLNTSMQLGSELGLATARTRHLLARHTAPAPALAAGFHRALLAGSLSVLAPALIALRAPNTQTQACAAAAG